MTPFGSRNAGAEIGFFLVRVAGMGWNFLTWASRWFRFPSMLCDFGWHSASAHSGSLWLYDLSQHSDTAVSSLFWLPLAARWSWHVFQPWRVKVCATLNRLQRCVTSLLPLTGKPVTDPNAGIFTWRSFQKGSNIYQEHWILNKGLMMFCDLYSDIVIHKNVIDIGTDKKTFVTLDFMQSQRKCSHFHVLVPHTVPMWGNWEWVSRGFRTGMASLSASHLLLVTWGRLVTLITVFSIDSFKSKTLSLFGFVCVFRQKNWNCYAMVDCSYYTISPSYSLIYFPLRCTLLIYTTCTYIHCVLVVCTLKAE